VSSPSLNFGCLCLFFVCFLLFLFFYSSDDNTNKHSPAAPPTTPTRDEKKRKLDELARKLRVGDFMSMNGVQVLAFAQAAGKTLPTYNKDYTERNLKQDDNYVDYLFEKLI